MSNWNGISDNTGTDKLNFHACDVWKRQYYFPIFRAHNFYQTMQENTKDKEKYCFLRPTGIETFTFIFSAGALQWLHGTTTDDDGREIGNFTLFGDLLARMALADGTAKGFHRPLTLSVGQAQYSEEQLSTQWNMGRKRIRRLLDELERL